MGLGFGICGLELKNWVLENHMRKKMELETELENEIQTGIGQPQALNPEPLNPVGLGFSC